MRIACGVTADGPRKCQRIVGGSRQVACGWRAGTGGAGGWRATVVFSSLELTYFGKRSIYQAKWACSSLFLHSKKSVDEHGPNEDTNFCCETRRYLSWIEGLTTNQYVGGSNPSRRTIQNA